MKGIILAAGRGSRMKGLTEDRPKCLIQLRDKSLLDWQTDALRQAGIQEIAVVTGYRRELLTGRGLREFHNPRWAETNMVSSLECANEWLLSGPCIVSYSDIFYQAPAVVSLLNTYADIAVTYDPHWRILWERRFGNPLLDAETFRINGDDSLSEIGNKPHTVDEIQGQYMGLLRFSPKGWSEILRIRSSLPAAERDRMHMTGTLQKVVAEGKISIMAVPYEGIWGEIDNENDLSLWNRDGV